MMWSSGGGTPSLSLRKLLCCNLSSPRLRTVTSPARGEDWGRVYPRARRGSRECCYVARTSGRRPCPGLGGRTSCFLQL